MQAHAGGPAGLSPLHLAALLQDQGACARSLVRADTGMAHAWVSWQTDDGKTPQDFAQLAGAADLLKHNAPRQPFRDVQQRQAPARHMRSQSDVSHSHAHSAPASPCCEADAALAWHQTGHKRQKVVPGEDSRAQAAETGGSQQSEQCGTGLKQQDGQIKRTSMLKSSRQRLEMQTTMSSQEMSHNGRLQCHAPAADDFRDVQKAHWQLSSGHHRADDLENWEAASSEDESLAATHLELPCSDSEQSPLRAAFALEG